MLRAHPLICSLTPLEEDLQLRNAKPKDQKYSLSEGGGLALVVMPIGSKYGHFNYRYQDKQQTLALGVYPAVSWGATRDNHALACGQRDRRLIPSVEKKLAKFQAGKDVKQRFPAAGARAVGGKAGGGREHGIRGRGGQEAGERRLPFDRHAPGLSHRIPEILAILNRVESRAAETARRLRGFIGEVSRHAIVRGEAKIDPTVALKGAVLTRKAGHYAAITSLTRFGELMLASFERPTTGWA